MQQMTSALANKMIKNLEEDKAYWTNKERSSCTYVASVNEEPVIPEYDFSTVNRTIAEIDIKIAAIKHAINLTNATANVTVGDSRLSVDTILVKMAQLNRRKEFLDMLRKYMPKEREEPHYGVRNAVPEYRYINYDLDIVKGEYERVSKEIMDMQLALDKYNQTVTFEIDI